MIERILIVGCGNMGGAMLAGWLRGGINPARFTVVDPVLTAAPAGVTLLRAVPADTVCDVVVLGVKPQLFADVAPSIAPAVGTGTVVCSMLAGTELASLAAALPGAAGYVRIMPNLAAALGKSPVALAQAGLDAVRQLSLIHISEPTRPY